MNRVFGAQGGWSRFRDEAAAPPPAHAPADAVEGTAAVLWHFTVRNDLGDGWPGQPLRGSRNRSSVMNSIIYIVGLVVVVAIVLSLVGII
jgi:hypothetical protein